jgi:Uma2 family endonuclease
MMQPMPRVPPFDRPATYEDLIALPDNLIAEIVNGELHASPRPAPAHAITGSLLGVALGAPFTLGRGGPGGWLIIDEPELHLQSDVLVPDLGGWKRERMPRRPATAYFPFAPDWICEVLSPSTVQIDRARKMRIYAREGVAHAWLVDPLAQTLEVLRLEGGRWALLGTHAGDEVVRAEPFEQIDLELRLIWSEPADASPPRS